MTLWDMLSSLAVTSMLAFGNGGVMVAMLQHHLVEETHAISNEQLLYAFALARITPGQANLYVASLGYMLFKWPGAFLSILVIVLPSFLMIPAMSGYERLRRITWVPRFTRGIAATAVGLLLATSWNVLRGSLNAPITWVVLAVALLLMLRTRLPMVASLGIVTAVGIVGILALPALSQNVM